MGFKKGYTIYFFKTFAGKRVDPYRACVIAKILILLPINRIQ